MRFDAASMAWWKLEKESEQGWPVHQYQGTVAVPESGAGPSLLGAGRFTRRLVMPCPFWISTLQFN